MLPGVECPKCGETWSGFISYPAVDLSSLPERHEDAVAHLLASERFVEVVLRLGASDVLFREVQTAPPGTASDSP
jgi:hypothetical protein